LLAVAINNVGRNLTRAKNYLAKSPAFERISKRRKGFLLEKQVRGDHQVHGNKDLIEKLGRNELYPCGSGLRFQTLLSAICSRSEPFYPSP
jgi:hypothetical protein